MVKPYKCGFNSRSFEQSYTRYHAGVANNRSVGCLVGSFFRKIKTVVTSRLPTRSNPPKNVKRKKYEPQWFVFLSSGGGEGIRTPVGLHPNGFQDRLVMTASIRLRDCGAFALPSYYIPFYLKNQPFGISFSFFALKSLCKIRLCAKMFYI